MTRVFVTGGSGVLGRALIPTLVAAGLDVDALVRSGGARDRVAALGAHPIPGDLLDPGGVAPISADVVIHFASSIPRHDTGPESWSTNDRIRTEGAEALVAAAREGSVRRFVGYSVCWVYGDHGDGWITERTELPDPSEMRPEIRSAAALEQIVRSSSLEWCVLRGGWLYGPDTGVTEGMLAAAAAGRLVTNGHGDDFVSMVTAADVAQGAKLAVAQIPAGTTLNIVDDVPLRERDAFAAFASHVGGAPISAGPPEGGWGSLRVSNGLARSFGFRPLHPSLGDGLAALHPWPAASPPTSVRARAGGERV